MPFNPVTIFVCGPRLPWRPGITQSMVGHPAARIVPEIGNLTETTYRCPHCGFTWTEELE